MPWLPTGREWRGASYAIACEGSRGCAARRPGVCYGDSCRGLSDGTCSAGTPLSGKAAACALSETPEVTRLQVLSEAAGSINAYAHPSKKPAIALASLLVSYSRLADTGLCIIHLYTLKHSSKWKHMKSCQKAGAQRMPEYPAPGRLPAGMQSCYNVALTQGLRAGRRHLSLSTHTCTASPSLARPAQRRWLPRCASGCRPRASRCRSSRASSRCVRKPCCQCPGKTSPVERDFLCHPCKSGWHEKAACWKEGWPNPVSSLLQPS